MSHLLSRRLPALLVIATLVAPMPARAATFTPVSFQVSQMGAATFEIGIAVPPGTAGVAPKLSLTYSSQGSGGLAGAGLSLNGLSAIARCGRTLSQDGINSGLHYDADDRYCLDGQRLVMVSGAAYGASGAVYRSEMDDFTKVVSNGTAGSGPASFTAWTKSGLILEFGETPDSRIEATSGRTDVRVWALNKIRDVKGNYMSVTYTEDTASSAYYPQRIDYTGNASTGAATFASVRLTYETRTDVSEMFLGGVLVRSDQRLLNVKTYAGDTLVRDYRIGYTYSSGDGASLPNAITECAADSTCLPATTLGWQLSTGTVGFGASVPFNTLPGGTDGDVKLAAGDLNGDGLADVIYASGGRLYYQLSTGSGFSSPVDAGSWPTTLVLGASVPQELAVGDVNGDGRADVIAANGQVWLSAGTGLNAPVQWASLPGTSKIGVGDINGDGRADLVYADSQLYYALSTGTAFSAGVLVGSWDQVDLGYGMTSVAQLLVGDVNGDGRADIVSGARGLWLSNGAGLPTRTNSGAEPWGGNALMAVGDINGDGFADLIYAFWDGLPRPSPLAYQLSNGAAFTSTLYYSGAWDVGQYAWDVAAPAVGDFNGDGRGDLLSTRGGARAGNVITPNLLASVTNGLGLVTTITYKPLSDASVYTPGTSAVWPERDVIRQTPIYVVASVSTPTGPSNYVTNYFYREAKVHVYGRGVLGFKVMETLDPQTGINASTTFRQDMPYIGLPAEVTKVKSGVTLNRVTNTYGCKEDLNPCTVGINKRYFVFASQSDEASNDLNGAFINRVRTTSTYDDAYGNVKKVEVENLTSGGAATGYKKTTENTYLAADTGNWILGRLTRATVTSTAPDIAIPGNPGGVAAGDPPGTPAAGISISALIAIIQTLLLD